MGLWDMPSMKTLPKSDVLFCCHITNLVSLWDADNTAGIYIIKGCTLWTIEITVGQKFDQKKSKRKEGLVYIQKYKENKKYKKK